MCLSRSQQPFADHVLDGGEFLIGLVELGLGGLRAELGGERVIFRADDALFGALHAGEVREVVEAGAAQAYNACTPTAVLLSQRLIGAKVFVK